MGARAAPACTYDPSPSYPFPTHRSEVVDRRGEALGIASDLVDERNGLHGGKVLDRVRDHRRIHHHLGAHRLRGAAAGHLRGAPQPKGWDCPRRKGRGRASARQHDGGAEDHASVCVPFGCRSLEDVSILNPVCLSQRFGCGNS